MRTLFITVVFICQLLTIALNGQGKYELLYLEGKSDDILSASSHKSTGEDFFWNAQINREKGYMNLAMEVLEEGLMLYQGNEKMERLLSDLYYESGDYLKARPLLQKYQAEPGNFLKLITLLEFQSNHSEAIELIQQRLSSDSLNLSLLIHLGDNLYQMDSLELAKEIYRDVFSMNPVDQVTAYKLVSLQIKDKEYEEAIQICDTILMSDSLNMKFIRARGSASFSNRDFKTAEACFHSLFESGDSGIFVLKHLGISEFQNDQYYQSIEHLQKAYDKKSDDVEVCYTLGKGYLTTSRGEEALFYFNKADALLQPDSLVMSSLYLEKQSVYSMLKMYDEALECFLLAYEYDDQPKYLFFIASMYQHRFKDPVKAIEFYTRFLESLPPPVSLADNPDLEGQVIISLKDAAENMINELKEELFFNGRLDQ